MMKMIIDTVCFFCNVGFLLDNCDADLFDEY